MKAAERATHGATCTCRDHPLPAAMRVRDALAVYLAENGFTTESYESPKTTGSFFGMKVAVPNPPSHQRAIRLHDLLHLVTGFGTDHAGEGELSAWQARRGFRGMGAYVTAITLVNTVVGVWYAPRRIKDAFHDGRGPSLFARAVDYESLLDRTVGELRALLDVPERGVATLPRGLHSHAPT